MKKYVSKSRIIFSAIISYFFSVFVVIGAQLHANGMTDCGYVGKGMILLKALPVTIPVLLVIYCITTLTDINLKNKHETEKKNYIVLFFISFDFIFIAYIPVLLAYYPAIMAYDFHRQSQEAIYGFSHFWPYQPIVHTWMYWLFFKIGGLFGSLQIGMAFYSLFQMLVMSAVLGYAATLIYRLVHKKWCYIVATVFFGLFPFFSVMVVEATKDVIFSALFVLFLLILLERVFFEHKKKWLLDLFWILDGMILTQFRKNAIYAIAVFLIVYIIVVAKKEKIRTIVLSAILIVACELTSFAMPKIIGTDMEAPAIEKYNVLIQSFARTAYYHHEDMEEGMFAALEYYVPHDRWIEYNPAISDGVKWSLDGNRWTEDSVRLFRTWIDIGKAYPNEYIDSFFLTNAGYIFFDDVSWCEVLGVGLEGRMGAIYTYNSTVSDAIPEGIAHESKFPALESALEEIVSNNAFNKIPIIRVLFTPALYVWISFIGLCIFAFTKQREKAIIATLPVMYFLTLLMGPMVCWRYIYPVALFIPVLIALWFAGKKTDSSVEKADGE